MVPADYRGKRNMPKYLPLTAAFLADLLKIDLEELAARLWENANRFFGLENE
jgi:TatD DNase family protein